MIKTKAIYLTTLYHNKWQSALSEVVLVMWTHLAFVPWPAAAGSFPAGYSALAPDPLLFEGDNTGTAREGISSASPLSSSFLFLWETEEMGEKGETKPDRQHWQGKGEGLYFSTEEPMSCRRGKRSAGAGLRGWDEGNSGQSCECKLGINRPMEMWVEGGSDSHQISSAVHHIWFACVNHVKLSQALRWERQEHSTAHARGTLMGPCGLIQGY